MTDQSANLDNSAPPSGKKPLIIGLVAFFILGAGGFYAVYSGLVDGRTKSSTSENESGHDAPEEHIVDSPAAHGDQADSEHGATGGKNDFTTFGDIAFVPLRPLIISLGKNTSSQHLRFVAELEVAAIHVEDVVALTPRILDVLNGYLRAIEVPDIENPANLPRLRAQMLRRVQVVAGEGNVRDILVTEFVLN